MKSKLVMVNVPVTDHKKAQAFYQSVFEQDFARSLTDETEGYHLPISIDGIFATLVNRYSDKEGITPYFAVDDLGQALEITAELGGQTIAEPFDLPMPSRAMEYYKEIIDSMEVGEPVTETMGKAAIVLDPDGNAIGLVQLETHAHAFFRYGEFAAPVSEEQLDLHERAKKAGVEFFER